MQKKDVSGTELKGWVNNYMLHKDLPVYTNWAVIMIDDLDKFVRTVKADGADAVAISLIRFPLDEDGPPFSSSGKPRIKTAGLGLSQVSFALIAGNTTVKEPWTLTAKKNGDAKYTILCICEPGTTLTMDGAGLCPPQGGEIIIEGP